MTAKKTETTEAPKAAAPSVDMTLVAIMAQAIAMANNHPAPKMYAQNVVTAAMSLTQEKASD